MSHFIQRVNVMLPLSQLLFILAVSFIASVGPVLKASRVHIGEILR